MKKFIASIAVSLALVFGAAAQPQELRTIYLGFRGPIWNPSLSCFVTVVAGAENCISIPANFLCTGTDGQRNITWNYFAETYGVTGPVYIYLAHGNAFDTTASAGKFFSIQRASDQAFILFIDMDGRKQNTARNDFAGHYIKLEQTDALLIESACTSDNSRVIGASLYFTTTPPAQ